MNLRIMLRALIAAAIGFGIGLAAQAKGVDAQGVPVKPAIVAPLSAR